MREVRWERMFPDELEAAYAQCPVAYFAYGLCEPHGPQNAIGLDGLKAHAIACRAAHAHGGIVAPADMWHMHEIGGYASWAHDTIGNVERSWLTSVPPWHYLKSLCYHVQQADALGFHAAIFLTGHYGPNWQDANDVIAILQPHCGTRLYGLPDFEANEPGFDGRTGDHAGKVETSLLWAVEPDCVDVSRIPAGLEGRGGPYAMGGDAGEADRRVGERMVDDETRWLGEKARELLADYDKLAPEHAFVTFDAVERVWREEIAPALPAMRTMQEKWGGEGDLPDDSVWKRNQPVPDIT